MLRYGPEPSRAREQSNQGDSFSEFSEGPNIGLAASDFEQPATIDVALQGVERLGLGARHYPGDGTRSSRKRGLSSNQLRRQRLVSRCLSLARPVGHRRGFQYAGESLMFVRIKSLEAETDRLGIIAKAESSEEAVPNREQR